MKHIRAILYGKTWRSVGFYSNAAMFSKFFHHESSTLPQKAKRKNTKWSTSLTSRPRPILETSSLAMGGCKDVDMDRTYQPQMLHGARIFTYIWDIFEVNVGKYSIHGTYGNHIETHRSVEWCLVVLGVILRLKIIWTHCKVHSTIPIDVISLAISNDLLEVPTIH